MHPAKNIPQDDTTVLDDQDRIKLLANTLLDAYLDSTDKDGNTCLKGLLYMKNVMDSVAYDFRGQVFASFLTLLQFNGIKYDHKIFQANPSEAIH